MRIRRLRSVLLITPFVLGFAGCSDKSTVEERTKVSTPDGTTTVKKETTVESSGSNPPPASTGSPSGAPR
ncbi:MAG: hypothetical protein U0790_09450 [Isosphaeraceae bacterium]